MMLERLRQKLSIGRHRPGYRSRFGGLWTDAEGGAQRCESLERDGTLDAASAARLREWMRDGYVILPQAVPLELVDAIDAAVAGAWETLDARLLVEIDGTRYPLDPARRGRGCKLLDLYVDTPAALDAAFQAPILDFLRLLFDDDPLLFQGLSFEYGSQQEIHQDTAYVVVDKPMELAAAWIALEDVQPGSGELTYYPGSHRFGEHLFAGRYRNWNRERDGEAEKRSYLAGLHDKAHAAGIELVPFLPRKGDVLVWSADLAHGGAPITDPTLTRKSFVCHYCPASARPYYFSYRRDRRDVRRHRSGGRYASAHYPLGG